MLPFSRLENPVRLPYACVGCGLQRGPFVDTKREIRGYGDVIICSTCAKTTAEILGFAPGKKLDQLSNAVKREAELEREIEQLRAGKAEHEEDWTKLTAIAKEQEARIGELNGRIEQLEKRLRDHARADLELVTGSAA